MLISSLFRKDLNKFYLLFFLDFLFGECIIFLIIVLKFWDS